MKPTLGVRRNNPGNIEYNPKNKWQGAVRPHDGHRFDKFEAPVYGIRALAVLLINYQDSHGLDTIRKVITRWAPPKEKAPGSKQSQTAPYIRHVAEQTKFGVDQRLDLHNFADLFPLVKAIIRHECAYDPYPDDLLRQGVRRAGAVEKSSQARTKQKSVMKESASAQAGAAVVASGAVPAIVAAADAIAPHSGLISTVVSVAPWILIPAFIIAILAGGYIIWRAIRRRREGIE